MSAPFSDFGCLRTPLSSGWGAQLFSTHRKPYRRTHGGPFPANHMAGSGVMGGFYLIHDRNMTPQTVGVHAN